MMHKSGQRFIVPKIFQDIPNLVAGVSTRHGGVSQQPYLSLNLGIHTADSQDLVQENLTLLCQDLGIKEQQLARAYQCHGASIWHANEGSYQENYDAIIANQIGVIAGVGIADCCPILLVDPIQKITAAIHAGWKGTVSKIVYSTANVLIQQYQSNPSDVLAWVGPCISQKHFEVGDEVAVHFSEKEKKLIGEKYYVDLKSANVHQLQAIGINQIEVSEKCTIEHNDDFFSHRKEKGLTGRMMAFAGFKK
jgi:YfiH family protein